MRVKRGLGLDPARGCVHARPTDRTAPRGVRLQRAGAMRITTKQSRGWIVALGATPLLALMLSVGIGHADSRMRGGNPGGGHERGSAGSWSGGRGGSSWRGGGNGGGGDPPGG